MTAALGAQCEYCRLSTPRSGSRRDTPTSCWSTWPSRGRLLADVRDASKRANCRFVCVPEPGTGPDEIIEQLRLVYAIQTRVPVLLPKPLPRMIRSWVRAFRDEDLLGSCPVTTKIAQLPVLTCEEESSLSIRSCCGARFDRL